MRLETISILLTLVLNMGVALAAPTADVYPPKPLETQTDESFSRRYQKGGPTAYYQSAFDFSAAFLSGKLEHDKDSATASAFRLAKNNYNLDYSSQHFGIDIFGNNMIGWNVGYRKILLPEEWYEPFWSYELATIYTPRDGLGNFINLKRYFFAVGAGLDDIFGWRRRFHAEIQMRVGQAGTHLYGALTYSHPIEF